MAASVPLHVTRSVALRECVTAWYRTVAGVPSSNGALQQDQSQTMTFAELCNFLRTLLVQAGLGKLNHACFVYFSSLQVGGPHSDRLMLFTCGQRPVSPPATKRLLRQLSLIFVPSLSWQMLVFQPWRRPKWFSPAQRCAAQSRPPSRESTRPP